MTNPDAFEAAAHNTWYWRHAALMQESTDETEWEHLTETQRNAWRGLIRTALNTIEHYPDEEN